MEFRGNLFVVLIWLLLTLSISEKTVEIFSTTNGDTYPAADYGYLIGTSNCFVFEVRACQDAKVGLTLSNAFLAIHLGRLNNTEANIWHGSRFRQPYNETGILNCYEYNKFKIVWQNNVFSVYKWSEPCYWRNILQYSKNFNTVIAIGVGTADGITGEWILYNQGCYEPPSGTSQIRWQQNITNLNTDLQFPEFIFKDLGRQIWKCLKQCQSYDSCCYVTYDEQNDQCKGSSNITSYGTTGKTKFWTRY